MSVPGVAVVLIDSFSKRTLLLHRALHWSGWEYVKGGIEAGETAETAAHREVKEETGIRLSELHPLPTDLTFRNGEEERSFQVFLGVAAEQEVTLGLEHDDARWMTLAEAKTLLAFPDQIPPLEAAETLIKKLL